MGRHTWPPEPVEVGAAEALRSRLSLGSATVTAMGTEMATVMAEPPETEMPLGCRLAQSMATESEQLRVGWRRWEFAGPPS